MACIYIRQPAGAKDARVERTTREPGAYRRTMVMPRIRP